MNRKFAAVLALLLIAGAAVAQDGKQAAGLLERGIARIEHAVARLQSKLSGREHIESADGCRDMMRGGMMGSTEKESGMMRGGMMGGGMMGGGTPNDQWRGSNAR